MAATGKEGQAARHDALRLGDAGEVVSYLIEAECSIDGTLLDPDKPALANEAENREFEDEDDEGGSSAR